MKAFLQDVAVLLGLAIVLNLMNQHWEWYGWIAIAVFFAVYGVISFNRGWNAGAKAVMIEVTVPCDDPECELHGKAVKK